MKFLMKIHRSKCKPAKIYIYQWSRKYTNFMCTVSEISLLSRNSKKFFHVYPYISMFFSLSMGLPGIAFFHLKASLKFLSLFYLLINLLFLCYPAGFFSLPSSVFSFPSGSAASFLMIWTSSWPTRYSGGPPSSCIFTFPGTFISTLNIHRYLLAMPWTWSLTWMLHFYNLHYQHPIFYHASPRLCIFAPLTLLLSPPVFIFFLFSLYLLAHYYTSLSLVFQISRCTVLLYSQLWSLNK